MGALLEAIEKRTHYNAMQQRTELLELRAALCDPHTSLNVTGAELASGKLKKRNNSAVALKREAQPSFFQRFKKSASSIVDIGIGITILSLEAGYFIPEKVVEIVGSGLKTVAKKGRERWNSSTAIRETAIFASTLAVLTVGLSSIETTNHYVNSHIPGNEFKLSEKHVATKLPPPETQIAVKTTVTFSQAEEPSSQPIFPTEIVTQKTEVLPSPIAPYYHVYKVKAGDNMFNILRDQGLKTDVRTLHQIMLANPDHFKDLGFGLQDYYNAKQFKKILKEARLILPDWELNILPPDS